MYEFDDSSVASTDHDPRSTAGNISVQNTHVFFDWGSEDWFLCLDPSWATTTPQGPFNASPNYVEMTITPDPAQTLWISGISVMTGVGTSPAVDTIAVYADEDPGPGGDNFMTPLAADIDVYPQDPGNGGVATTLIDVSGAAILQGVTQATTIRIYFWSGPNAGAENAEIGFIKVEGCAGVTAIAQNLGGSCNNPLDPFLHANPPVVGGTCAISVSSQFPNALGWLFLSLWPVAPYPVPGIGCTIYVDILNMSNFYTVVAFTTDSNGSWELPVPILEPHTIGIEVAIQARLCAPTSPPGPLNPDYLTNGVYLRIGCPGS